MLCVLVSSLLFGNLYVYLKFGTHQYIPAETRLDLFLVLTAVSGVGCLLLLTLRTRTAGTSDEQHSLNASQQWVTLALTSIQYNR